MITALELRTQGIKAIDIALKKSSEGIISYKGKPKYVILPFEKYDELMAASLDQAYNEVMQNITDGSYRSVKTHKELDAYLTDLKKEVG